jgi:DNA-binding transcriptional ArsR family regulator
VEFEADIALAAAAIGNRARASILERLLDGRAVPAGALAAAAGVALSTTSAHLQTLIDAGLIGVERQGRQRRYRLASRQVAHAMEALATVAPRRPVTSLRAATSAERLRAARTCYDHLAGRLGVALSEALVATGSLQLRDGSFFVTRNGEALFRDLGVDLTTVQQRKRAFAIPCLDWTERRVHLAGALGAALCDRFLELGWIDRQGPHRAVALTTEGAANLRSRFGVHLETAEESTER